MLSSTEFHKDFLGFRISIREIGITGFQFKELLKPEALSALIFEPKNEAFSWRAHSLSEVHFEIERENDHAFKVRTKANLELDCPCARCLRPVTYKLTLDFVIRMLEKEHFLTSYQESSTFHFDSDEIDFDAHEDSLVGYFHDKCIDLGVILRDQIFLEVPDYPHCSGKTGSTGASCGLDSELLHNKDERSNNPFVKLLKKTT